MQRGIQLRVVVAVDRPAVAARDDVGAAQPRLGRRRVFVDILHREEQLVVVGYQNRAAQLDAEACGRALGARAVGNLAYVGVGRACARRVDIAVVGVGRKRQQRLSQILVEGQRAVKALLLGAHLVEPVVFACKAHVDIGDYLARRAALGAVAVDRGRLAACG